MSQNETTIKNIFTGEELLSREEEEMPTLMNPVLPVKGLVAIAGASDSGKSSFLRQLAVAIVTEKESFLDFKLEPEHKSVLYYSTEDDDNAVSILLKKMKDTIDDTSKMKNLRYIFHQNDVFAELNRELKKQKADVVIIDAFADLFPGNMNATNEVRNFLNKFVKLVNKHNCLMIILHHTGKRTDSRPPSKHNLVGSQGFEAKMRMVMELRKDNAEGNLRHLCVVKGNYLPEEYKSHSFVLEFGENQMFDNTGIRTPFDDLVDDDEQQSKRKKARDKAKKLKKEGKSYEKIAEIISKDGFKVSKSTIGNWLKDAA